MGKSKDRRTFKRRGLNKKSLFDRLARLPSAGSDLDEIDNPDAVFSPMKDYVKKMNAARKRLAKSRGVPFVDQMDKLESIKRKQQINR